MINKKYNLWLICRATDFAVECANTKNRKFIGFCKTQQSTAESKALCPHSLLETSGMNYSVYSMLLCSILNVST